MLKLIGLSLATFLAVSFNYSKSAEACLSWGPSVDGEYIDTSSLKKKGDKITLKNGATVEFVRKVDEDCDTGIVVKFQEKKQKAKFYELEGSQDFYENEKGESVCEDKPVYRGLDLGGGCGGPGGKEIQAE